MVSKRKVQPVPKARVVIRAQPKLPKPDNQRASPETRLTEDLIRINGDMVEELFLSEAWVDIVKPLLDESIAGVSGRFSNGRYHHGDLTRTTTDRNYLAGYQRALMDFHNNLQDFIGARDNLLVKKRAAKEESEAPLINPFMEDTDDTAS